MTKREKQIATQLRSILDRNDIEQDGLITRKPSQKHTDNIDVLIQHISLLVTDLRFDAEASRREMSAVKSLLDEN